MMDKDYDIHEVAAVLLIVVLMTAGILASLWMSW
jgi:hypothetical protein